MIFPLGAAPEVDFFKPTLKGNIKHSVARWCFQDYTLPDLLPQLKTMGIQAIDLVGPDDWPTLKKHGVYCSMANGAEISLTEGFNEPKYHAQLQENYLQMIPKVKDAGYQNLICFSGNRRSLSDAEGMENCVEGLKPVIESAQKHGVIVLMELFNSKIDHPDYMADKSAWGVELCQKINSPHFKLLYDIYHMQINEGDIIRTIQEHHPYFGHYHTAGVPGRHEIEEEQELYYPAVMQAIHQTGFGGYVAQEFIPTRKNPLESLAKSVQVCDI